MWEDTSKKRTILNIFLIILILAVIVGIAFFVRQLSEQTAAHDKELSEAYVQQQQKQTEAR